MAEGKSAARRRTSEAPNAPAAGTGSDAGQAVRAEDGASAGVRAAAGTGASGARAPRAPAPVPAATPPSASGPAAAPAAAGPAGVSLRDEESQLKRELDRSNTTLKRLLRELDERGPNAPNVPQLWEQVRRAASNSDQLIQRLDRVRSDMAAQSGRQDAGPAAAPAAGAP